MITVFWVFLGAWVGAVMASWWLSWRYWPFSVAQRRDQILSAVPPAIIVTVIVLLVWWT